LLSDKKFVKQGGGITTAFKPWMVRNLDMALAKITGKKFKQVLKQIKNSRTQALIIIS